MNILGKIIITGALAGASLMPFSAPEAAAFPRVASSLEQQSIVTDVAWRRSCRFGKCKRIWIRRPVIIVPRIVVKPRAVVTRRYSKHVRWCLSRYRSYDPATDTFIGYDGRAHVCVSPF